MEKVEKNVRTVSKKEIKKESRKITNIMKIENRNTISYFIPKDLLYFTKMKKFKYKYREFSTLKQDYVQCESNINPNYILYILHTMCMRYFTNTKKSRTFKLSSVKMQENITNKYHPYLDYLEKENILIKKYNYSSGRNCSAYALNDKYYDGDFVRFDMGYKTLINRWKKKKKEDGIVSIVNKKNHIDKSVLQKLQEDIEYVEIDHQGAIQELEKMFPNKFNKKNEDDKLKYFKNLSSIENINEGNLYCIGDVHGRLHTNFTCLKKAIREKHLTIDGEEIAELDIDNSQPLFLALLMKENNAHEDELYKDSFNKFFDLVVNGNFYKYMMDNTGITSKSICKEIVFTVFFGKNNLNKKGKKENTYFRMAFPSIFKWIKDYKTLNNSHKALAHSLQNRESDLIFNKVCYFIKKKYPHIRLFTIHDSICFPKKYKKEVSEIFYKYVDALIY